MQTVEQKVLARVRRGMTHHKTKRPISLVALAHYYPESWPRLRQALLQLENDGKIAVGVAPVAASGMYIHVYPANRVPENVRVVSMERRTKRRWRMEHVNQKTQEVLDKLTEGLNQKGNRRRFKSARFFIAVVVEHLGESKIGPLFSVAQYYGQTVDLQAHPKMIFLRGSEGQYFPVSLQFDESGSFKTAILFEDDEPVRVDSIEQARQAFFAMLVMRCIKSQQEL